MSGQTRQLISITLIVALWMPAVMLPTSAVASSTTTVDITESPSPNASLFSFLWANLATIFGSATQDDEITPPGMPLLERPRRQPATPKPLLSKEDRKTKVAALKINPANEVTLEAGQQIMLAAIALDSAGNPVHGLGAEWESNRPDVVSITPDGLATAREIGKAHLTASAGNKQESLSVTVTLSSTRPDKSLAHAPRLSRVRASLAQQAPFFDEDLRRYIGEVGAPPGQAEPGAPTPPAAVGGTEKPGSANFTFDVPIVNLPGRGLDVSLALVYNSRLWNKKKNGSITTFNYDVDQNWPAPGFTLGYGKLLWSSGGYVLIDGSGTRHAMKPTNGTSADDATEWETIDGTFTRLSTNGGYKIVFTNGTQVSYSGTGASLFPVKITDRQGNFINISYLGSGPRISTITDTLNRTVTFNYEGNELVSITVPPYSSGADRQVVRFYYRNLVVNPSGTVSFSGVTIPASSQNKSVRVISHVYFPGTQTGYAYQYSNPQSNGNAYSNPYGMIYRIEQRRGMTISTSDTSQVGTVTGEGVVAASTEYDYPTTSSALSDVPKYTRRTDDWAGRTTAAPPFYTFAVTEGTPNLSVVTAPDGTVTETETYGSSSSLAGTVRQITVKRPDGTVLSKTVFNWTSEDDGSYPLLTQFLSTNEAGQTRGTVYTYDTGSIVNNNIWKVSERDFTTDGSLSPVEVLRTETTYEKGAAYLSRRLARLPLSVKVFEGGSTVAASFVQYKYDETALTERAGLAMYADPQSAQRGNVTKVIAYNNAAAQDLNTATVNQSVYDTTGNPVSLTLNCCQQKTIAYAEAYMFAYPTGETRGSAPDLLTTSSTYDFNTGATLSSTDENNQVTALSYYPESMRLDTVYRPDTGYTRYHYFDGLVSDPDTAHPHNYVAVATASGAGTVVWSYQFMDGRGAVARSFTSHTAANGWQTTDVEYDEMGRTKRASRPYYSTGSSAAIPTVAQMWTSVEQYDGLGRATQVRLPDSTLVQTAYAGRTTTVTDQAGRQRRQVTDALGRVIRVDEPDAAGNLGTITAPAQPTDYEYNALGNLTKVTQAGPGGVTQQRIFRYDSLGHLTHERQVEAAATLNDDGARLSSGGLWTGVYKYNQHGLIKDAYDARGVHTSFDYDRLNRIHQVNYSGESGAVRTPNVIYSYDQLHTGYFNKGRLTEVRTDAVNTAGVQNVPQTVQAFDYDLMGRVKSQQQTVGADSYTLSYPYNLLGQMTSETYPSGRVVSYEYDDGARLKKVANGSAGNYATSFIYKPHGALEAMTMGNGAVQTVSYNERLQPEQIKLTVAGVEKQRFDYHYGKVNLSTGAVDAAQNTGQVARVEGFIDGVRQWQQRFSYDAIGRLDIGSEHKGSNLQQLSWSVEYDYDRWANRYQSSAQNQNIGYVSVTASDISTQTNRLTNQTTYDDAGNVLVDGKFRAQQYRYDSNGRQVWSAEINSSLESRSVYDGLGQRVQLAENGTVRNMIYDISGKLIAEYGGQVVGTGGTHYVMAAQQDSTRVVMSGSGAIEARHDYLPFGEEIQSDTELRTPSRGYGGVDSIRQRYTGMERDFNGLDHTLWRKYESRAGRWTTPDPYNGSMSVGDPQSFNRFAYVGNDPINQNDPSGLFGIDASVGSEFIWGGLYGGEGKSASDLGRGTFYGGSLITENYARYQLNLLETYSQLWYPWAKESYGEYGAAIALSLAFLSGRFAVDYLPQNAGQNGTISSQQQERQRQQQGFNDCAKSAIRTLRRAEYPAIAKMAVGTFLTALTAGAGVEAGAANATAVAGVRSAGRIVGFTARYKLGQALAYGSSVVSAFTGTLAVNGYVDSSHNHEQLNKDLANCRSQFPQANHSTIGIFVTTY